MKTVKIVGEELGFGEIRISVNIKLLDFAREVRIAMAEKDICVEDLAKLIHFDPKTLLEVLYVSELRPEMIRHLLDLFKLIEEIAAALGVTEGSLLPEPSTGKPKLRSPIHIPGPLGVVNR